MNEQLKLINHIVTKLSFKFKGDKTLSGTGFFYGMPTKNGGLIPLLVTNSHNVRESISVEFRLSLRDENGGISTNNFVDTIIKGDPNWIHHPRKEVDICVLQIGKLINKINDLNHGKILWNYITPVLIITKEELETLSPIEEIIMVGYPSGLIDEVNNMPIFRKGITATSPNLDFNGDPNFLGDISTFSGSSGSPVFLIKKWRHIPDGKDEVEIQDYALFLGVINGNYTHKINNSSRTESVKVPNGLGVIHHAHLMNDFKAFFSD